MTNPASGWYSDPEVPAQQRYWDGERWTDHVAPLVHIEAPTFLDVTFNSDLVTDYSAFNFNDGMITLRTEHGDNPPPFSLSDVVAMGWNTDGVIEGTVALVQPVSGLRLATQKHQHPLRADGHQAGRVDLPDSLDRNLQFVLLDDTEFGCSDRSISDEWWQFLQAVVAPLALNPNIQMTDACRRDLAGLLQQLIAEQTRKQATAQRKAARAETSHHHWHL